jgi:hypothetical protein
MRTCGECSACCVAFDVGALEKPAGVPCPHLRAEGGCGIYPRRPDSCRAFACAWLTNVTWPDEERPDRLGVVVAPADEHSAFASSAAIPHFVAYELRPGALDSIHAEPLLKRLSRQRLVAVVRHGWEHRDREPSGFIGESEPVEPSSQPTGSGLLPGITTAPTSKSHVPVLATTPSDSVSESSTPAGG